MESPPVRRCPPHRPTRSAVAAGPLAFPIALVFENHLVGIVGEAVDRTVRQDRIVEERDPLIDGPIRGESRGRTAVPFEDDFVEVMGLRSVEPAESEVVNDQDLGREEPAEDFVGRVIGARLPEVLGKMVGA